MESENNTIRYPWWVRQSLVGMSSRRSLVWLQWIGYIIGTSFLEYMIITKKWDDHMLLVFSILGILLGGIYQWSIRWIDRHGDWNRMEENKASAKEVALAVLAGFVFGGVVRAIF